MLRLNDTIGRWRPDMPAAWSKVTVRQLMNHTSGVPDYTRSEGFINQFRTDPQAYVAPLTVIDWVRADPLEFAPGSKYEYSNTDNMVLGLIAETVTREKYSQLLNRLVFGPARLNQTSFPIVTSLPKPFIHGYDVNIGKPPQDFSTILNPSAAWASGAIVSTPADLGRFIRALLGLKFFSRAEQRQQLRFVPGSSSPAGPGVNSAGLAIFRYRTRCGTVYGHTGNFPGYVQWVAATADGKRSVTSSLNIAAPTGKLLRQLRSMQADAVCALLRG
jgi:D-alanyl-D-alanine carboxypeptidase